MRNRVLKPLLAVAAIAALTGAAQARAEDATSHSAAADAVNGPVQTAPAVPHNLPPESPWRLGLALGYGERSNPLIQSDDIPVLVDVDVAWFGKRFFFDNGDIGFTALDNRFFTANLMARVNSDRAFFSKTNTKYVTFAQLGGGLTGPVTDPGTGQILTEPMLLSPPKRSYAIEAGVEVLMGGEWGNATLHGFRDVSQTHDGYEISAAYSYRWTHGRLSLSPSVGVAYKSLRYSDYYWGVHSDEASIVLPKYQVGGGIGWEAGLRANYYVTKKIRLAVSANYERLQHNIAQSPLVEQPYVFGYFAGLGWQF